MDTLPSEIINEILLIVDRPSLFHTSQVCSQWRELSSQRTIIINTLFDFIQACKEGDYLSIINFKPSLVWLNYGFNRICKGGHKELVNLMIGKGVTNWNKGFFEACRGGHKEIAELMIVKGATHYDYGFFGACQGGRKDIVELMISKGVYDWNHGLSGACQGGRKDIVELMIAKGANSWYWGLAGACQRGDKELVEFMIAKGADDWNLGLENAYKGGHKELAELMIIKGANRALCFFHPACLRNCKAVTKSITKDTVRCPCGKSLDNEH